MLNNAFSVMLADDDEDDCALFIAALQTASDVAITVVHNGEQLMSILNQGSSHYPDVLFLDLNMPRKSGKECLIEIKQNEDFDSIIIIIYSTSYMETEADYLYEIGANYYIKKPATFDQLRQVLHSSLSGIRHNLSSERAVRATRDMFRLF